MWCVCRVFEHRPSVDIHLVLNTGPHVEGTVQQQDDAVSVFDLGTWLLQHWMLQFASFVLLRDLKSRSKGVTVSRGNITSLEDACDLQLFTWDAVGCLHCVRPWFPVDTNWMVMPCLVTHHNVSQIHIFIVVLLQVFQWFEVWCLCLMSWVVLGGNSYDTLCYPGSSMMTCTVSSHMKIHWQGKNSPLFVLTHVILDLCSVLWINDSVRLFLSLCVCHSLLAHSEHPEPIHSCCFGTQSHHAFGYQCKQLNILPFQEIELPSSGHVWVDAD